MWKIWDRGRLVIMYYSSEYFVLCSSSSSSLPLVHIFCYTEMNFTGTLCLFVFFFFGALFEKSKRERQQQRWRQWPCSTFRTWPDHKQFFIVWLLQSKINGLPSFEREKNSIETRVHFLMFSFVLFMTLIISLCCSFLIFFSAFFPW